MSCIYGPHQFGTEDQGWVAHFLLRALDGRPITLYGDGMQVRDVLYVEDLVRAFLLAERHIDAIAGQAFNMGGGPANTVSPARADRPDRQAPRRDARGPLRGLAHGRPALLRLRHRPSSRRPPGWRPRVNVREGVGNLYNWLLEFRGLAEAPVTAERHAS